MRHRVSGKIEFDIVKQTPELVEAEMPIQEGILNPFGVVHAGATLWFADVAASILVLGEVEASEGMKGFPLAINLNASLLGNQREGTFFASSCYVKKGRTLSVVRTLVTDDGGKLIAEVSTNHILSK